MIKDVLLIIGVAYSLMVTYTRRKFLKPNHTRILIWIAIIFVFNSYSFAVSPAGFAEKLFNFRRNTMFIAVFLLFSTYPTPKAWIKYYSLVVGFITIVLLAFGFFEYFQSDEFWDVTVQIPNYWRTIGFDLFGADSVAVSGRFYSWDLAFITGKPVRRMVSLYFEPTTFAAFLVAVFCITVQKRLILTSIVIFAAGCLTMSKFFITASVIVVILSIWPRLINKINPFKLVGIILASCLIVLTFDLESGAFEHLRGLTSIFDTFANGAWLGYGLGVAGNYSFGDLNARGRGEESGFGNLVGQIGVGAFAYLFLLHSIQKSIISNNSMKMTGQTTVMAKLSLIAWTISFFLSASALGLSGNAMLFILVGYTYMVSSDPLTFHKLSIDKSKAINDGQN